MAPHRPTSSLTSQSSSDDTAVVRQGDSALASAQRNFSYLINPSKTTDPPRLRTRALLRTLNYVCKFVFWRLVRYAKYVAIGSLVAAVGATAFGGVISGAAWIAAPPTFGASIIAATVWYLGKWGANRLQRGWAKSRDSNGNDCREGDHELMDGPVRRDDNWRQQTGAVLVPW